MDPLNGWRLLTIVDDDGPITHYLVRSSITEGAAEQAVRDALDEMYDQAEWDYDYVYDVLTRDHPDTFVRVKDRQTVHE